MAGFRESEICGWVGAVQCSVRVQAAQWRQSWLNDLLPGHKPKPELL